MRGRVGGNGVGDRRAAWRATVADIVCQGPFIVGREGEEKEGLRDRGREGRREAVYGHVIRDIGKEERKEESRRQERTHRGTDVEK